MPDTHYEDILDKQLAMNRKTWAALQKLGVTEESKLRLDFSYAPSEAANSMRALFEEETDYEVSVESDGSFLRRRWRVREKPRRQRFLPRFWTSGSHGWSRLAKSAPVILTDRAPRFDNLGCGDSARLRIGRPAAGSLRLYNQAWVLSHQRNSFRGV